MGYLLGMHDFIDTYRYRDTKEYDTIYRYGFHISIYRVPKSSTKRLETERNKVDAKQKVEPWFLGTRIHFCELHAHCSTLNSACLDLVAVAYTLL